MTHRLPGADRFSASAQRVVEYLNRHTPISDWSVSRVAGGEQVHVHVASEGLIEVGDSKPWSETFCRRMTEGAAQVVPDSQADADYADLELAQRWRSYAGVPISGDDGDTFGVLCGAAATPLPAGETLDADLLAVFADLLSAQLAVSRELDAGHRQLEVSEALSQTDDLTGLLNRRGWDLLLDDAQERVDAFGDLVGLAVIDLDGLKQVKDTHGHLAGDRMLRRAADALRSVERRGDRVARYGGDEFAVLANNVPAADLDAYFLRYRDALAAAGTPGSIGWAVTRPGLVPTQAFALADRRMYQDKRARRVQRG